MVWRQSMLIRESDNKILLYRGIITRCYRKLYLGEIGQHNLMSTLTISIIVKGKVSLFIFLQIIQTNILLDDWDNWVFASVRGQQKKKKKWTFQHFVSNHLTTISADLSLNLTLLNLVNIDALIEMSLKWTKYLKM